MRGRCHSVGKEKDLWAKVGEDPKACSLHQSTWFGPANQEGLGIAGDSRAWLKESKQS